MGSTDLRLLRYSVRRSMSPCFNTGVLVKKSRTWTLEMAHRVATKPDDLSFIPSTIRVTHNHT